MKPGGRRATDGTTPAPADFHAAASANPAHAGLEGLHYSRYTRAAHSNCDPVNSSSYARLDAPARASCSIGACEGLISVAFANRKIDLRDRPGLCRVGRKPSVFNSRCALDRRSFDACSAFIVAPGRLQSLPGVNAAPAACSNKLPRWPR